MRNSDGCRKGHTRARLRVLPRGHRLRPPGAAGRSNYPEHIVSVWGVGLSVVDGGLALRGCHYLILLAVAVVAVAMDVAALSLSLQVDCLSGVDAYLLVVYIGMLQNSRRHLSATLQSLEGGFTKCPPRVLVITSYFANRFPNDITTF